MSTMKKEYDALEAVHRVSERERKFYQAVAIEQTKAVESLRQWATKLENKLIELGHEDVVEEKWVSINVKQGDEN